MASVQHTDGAASATPPRAGSRAVPATDRSHALRIHVPLPPTSMASRVAWEHVRALFRELDVPLDRVDTLRLVVAELVTNATQHAGTASLLLDVDGDQVWVGVQDNSSGRPTPRRVEAFGESGRGLHLVEALSSAWGTQPTADGKIVWASVQL